MANDKLTDAAVSDNDEWAVNNLIGLLRSEQSLVGAGKKRNVDFGVALRFIEEHKLAATREAEAYIRLREAAEELVRLGSSTDIELLAEMPKAFTRLEDALKMNDDEPISHSNAIPGGRQWTIN